LASESGNNIAGEVITALHKKQEPKTLDKDVKKVEDKKDLLFKQPSRKI